MAGKTYCILGGGGAFGIQTALYLLDNAEPEKVVGVGRSPLRPEPFTLGIEKCDRYEYKKAHLLREPEYSRVLLERMRPDVIINFAAQGEGAASWEQSWRFFDTNASALVRLYEALSQSLPDTHFIHIGTSELYGSVNAPAREDAPIVPSSPYAASKAAFDLYLLAMIREGRAMPTTILRPCNCYCPGQLLHRIVPRTIVSGLLGRKVPLHGGGKAEKSYMHTRDLARAIHLVNEGDARELRPVYNLGPRTPISIRQLGEWCASVLDVEFSDLFDVAPERPGQDARYWLNSSAAQRDLKWEPEVSLVAGLNEVRDWAEHYLDQLSDWPTDYRLRA